MAVTYKAKHPTYKTIQSDMWDMIALREYGDEHAMHYVQDANFYERFIDEFPGDMVLDITPSVVVQINLKSRRATPNLQQLLPWLTQS